ncbi:hypothetical protein DIPPA_16312 [Diplonema papillatum]|nr:hypothetical protein DIPPA_16312 [Diplonema papillatum]
MDGATEEPNAVSDCFLSDVTSQLRRAKAAVGAKPVHDESLARLLQRVNPQQLELPEVSEPNAAAPRDDSCRSPRKRKFLIDAPTLKAGGLSGLLRGMQEAFPEDEKTNAAAADSSPPPKADPTLPRLAEIRAKRGEALKKDVFAIVSLRKALPNLKSKVARLRARLARQKARHRPPLGAFELKPVPRNPVKTPSCLRVHGLALLFVSSLLAARSVTATVTLAAAIAAQRAAGALSSPKATMDYRVLLNGKLHAPKPREGGRKKRGGSTAKKESAPAPKQAVTPTRADAAAGARTPGRLRSPRKPRLSVMDRLVLLSQANAQAAGGGAAAEGSKRHAVAAARRPVAAIDANCTWFAVPPQPAAPETQRRAAPFSPAPPRDTPRGKKSGWIRAGVDTSCPEYVDRLKRRLLAASPEDQGQGALEESALSALPSLPPEAAARPATSADAVCVPRDAFAPRAGTCPREEEDRPPFGWRSRERAGRVPKFPADAVPPAAGPAADRESPCDFRHVGPLAVGRACGHANPPTAGRTSRLGGRRARAAGTGSDAADAFPLCRVIPLAATGGVRYSQF